MESNIRESDSGLTEKQERGSENSFHAILEALLNFRLA